MTVTKSKLVKRVLSAALAAALLLTSGLASAFAAGEVTREAVYVGVPTDVADGVYYADINMKNASNPKNYSMGNAALRGSESYKAKQTEDTEYRPIVIVENGKATALLEFMPMGYLGMYGFMMELEGIYPGSFSQYGMPNTNDAKTAFYPTGTLTYQKTVDGEIVYDGYNNPDSQYKFDGNKLRPAGFGKEESYLNIVDQPYSHLLSLDVTPVMVKDEDEPVPTKAEDYTFEQAAFCHVFVPVMFDISASSGDQYARMEVNWKTLEKIDNPDENVEYMFWKASNTSTDGYTAASVSAFESAKTEVHDALENVWAKRILDLNGTGFTAQPVLDLKKYSDDEKKEMAKKLDDAIKGLTTVDTNELCELIESITEIDSTLYTAESYKKLTEALDAAEAVLANANATQQDVDNAVNAIKNAVNGLEKVGTEEGWDGVTVKQPEVLGTSVDISSAEELAWLAQQVNSGEKFDSVFLKNDIDLNGKAWTAIGTSSNPFTGAFYGNGHTVSNLVVKGTDNYQGLFGYIKGSDDQKASVKSLTVQGVIRTTATNVGGVIGGALYTNIENIHSNVGITIDRVNNNDYVAAAGGVAGEAIYSDINSCTNIADITATLQEKVGGIAGYASGCYIRNSSNTGNINAGGSAGGIVGNYFVRSGSKGVISCFNKGTVYGNGSAVGGIIGTATSTGTDVQGVYGNLYNRGDVTAQHTVGGIIGSYSGGVLSMLTASYSTGKITGTVTSIESSGGLVGKMYSGMILYSYALEGTADELCTLGISSALRLVSSSAFHDEQWFKSNDFFTALGSAASSYGKDPENINDGYPVLAFELEEILNGKKADAVAELIAYKNADDYKGLAKKAVEQALSDGVAAITAAEDEDAVKEALANAKTALDAIPNDPNYGLSLDVIKEKLAKAKELEAAGGDLYTTESWNSFTATIAGIDYLLENGFETQEKVELYIGYLDTNTAGLTYIDADYTAVDEAIASIPADLSIYTEESVAALNAAKDAVVRGKNITEQAEVDAMAKAINDAVAALVQLLADYAKVDEAIASIPTDLSVYTEQSVAALNAAKDAVVRGKTVTEQAEVDAMAKAINDAVAALVYLDADYTEVDKALASIPADLSGYTEQSVAALNAAKDAVVRGKNITEQAEVDAMAKAVNDAVAALEKIDDSKLDFAKLPDGVYSIEFTMVKMNRIDLSMSNDAVNHTAKLTVKDGNYTLTVNFKGLHYLNRFGYLAKLSYYEDGYTFGKYGTVEGVLKAAEVITVQKNADGTDVTDEFNVPGGSAEGVKYPETVSFPVVSAAKADSDGFIALHVFVPAMEDIAAGNGDQDVLMKLDRSTLKKTDDKDPSFKPDDPEELSPAVDYTDPATGVRVTAEKGVLPEGVKVSVTEITSGDFFDKAVSALEGIGKFKLYKISFTDKDGNEVVPTGTVTVTYPSADGSSDNLSLYRINDDGSKTLVKGTLSKDGYTAVTKTAGVYALAETAASSDTETPDDGSSVVNGGSSADDSSVNGSSDADSPVSGNSVPKTGDSGMSVLLVLALLLSACALVYCLKSRKSQKGE